MRRSQVCASRFAPNNGHWLHLGSLAEVENPWKIDLLASKCLNSLGVYFPSHGRGRRFNPYNARHDCLHLADFLFLIDERKNPIRCFDRAAAALFRFLRQPMRPNAPGSFANGSARKVMRKRVGFGWPATCCRASCNAGLVSHPEVRRPGSTRFRKRSFRYSLAVLHFR